MAFAYFTGKEIHTVNANLLGKQYVTGQPVGVGKLQLLGNLQVIRLTCPLQRSARSSPLVLPQRFHHNRLKPSISLTWSNRNFLPDSDPTTQADARKRADKMSGHAPTMEELTSRRRYVPSEIWGDKLDLDTFEDYDLDEVFMSPPSEEQGLCRCCGRHICRNRAIMIAIDGACRGNGGPNARAACGVFGNVGSPFNETWVIDDDKPTSQ